ncbi:MAG: redoxin domain-containing protein [Fuerstiella sp.]
MKSVIRSIITYDRRTALPLLLLATLIMSLACVTSAQAGPSREQWRASALTHLHSTKDCRGTEFERGRTGEVLIFLRAGCPLADRYIRPLERLASQHKDVSFTIAIVDEQPESSRAMEWINSRKPKLRTVIDTGALCSFFEAAVSPEAFVCDADGELVYRGMIDDQHHPTRPSLAAADNLYLDEALTQLESGRYFFPRFTKADGCHVLQEETEFNRHIAPVIYDRCAMCHRPGDIKGDYPLTSYAEIKEVAKTIEWRMADQFMPPWRASHRGESCGNDLSLSLNEMWRFSDWIRNDMPVEGTPAEPPAKLTENKFRIPNPDAVVDIGQDYRVPAEGRLPYQYFMVESPFDTDRWITATEVRPGSPDVVHHINVFLLPPEEERDNRVRQVIETKLAVSRLKQRGDVVEPEALRMALLLYGSRLHRRIRFLSDFNPAESRTIFSDGTGFLLRKGAQLVFEVHYTPNGYAEATDRSVLALHAADEIPENWEAREPVTRVVGHMGQIHLEPGGQLTLSKELPFLADVEVLSLKPHMHYRGSSFEASLIHPDGTKQQLLHIPRWDYDFQMPYVFAKPVKAPAGSRLHVTYQWDNSTANPAISEAETKLAVNFGFQTEDEMSMAYPTYRYVNATAAEIREFEERVSDYLQDTTELPARN